MWPDFAELANSSLDNTYVIGPRAATAEHYLSDSTTDRIGRSSAPADIDAPDSTTGDMDFDDSELFSSTSPPVTLRTQDHMSNFRPRNYDRREVCPDGPDSTSRRNISNSRETVTLRTCPKHNRDHFMVNDGEHNRVEMATNNTSQRHHSDSCQVHQNYRSRHAYNKMRYRAERKKMSTQLSVYRPDSRRTSTGRYKVRRRMNYIPRPQATYWAPGPIANRLIYRARVKTAIDESVWQCLDCGMLPNLPVTGKCGHTRCLRCIQTCLMCPCGADFPWSPNVNIIIQDLIQKLLATNTPIRSTMVSLLDGSVFNTMENPVQKSESEMTAKQGMSQPRSIEARTGEAAGAICRIPITPEVRFKYAHNLVTAGQMREAAPHLAHVAACVNNECGLNAREALTEAVEILSQNGKPRQVDQELNDAVDSQAASSWLTDADLECILCYDTFSKPVTTPCGHTYCRTCLERSLDYRHTCALCKGSLANFDLAGTRDTEIVCSALKSIGVLKTPLEPDPYVIPIFTCTVAYPGMPCPLMVFDRRYWLMVRRVLKSGTRRFGMVACKPEGGYCDYGTILEVRDCVHLQSGCSILSTIGLSRFRVVKRDIWDGFDVARVQPIVDVIENHSCVIWQLQLMASQISHKAAIWINSMNAALRAQIESAFGGMPFINPNEEWWSTADGPTWLWWLVAILPLRTEIQVLVLATESLHKRMMTVSRTLDAVLQIVMSSPPDHVCEYQSALNENWLHRNL